MAKAQTYTDEELLSAVVRYADEHEGRIKYSELAKWARENMLGMESVRDYMFYRPLREKNRKTGKITEVKKQCTKRVEQINESRSTVHAVRANALLHSASVNTFFDLPRSSQAELIVKTRELVDKMAATDKYLKNQNQALKVENEYLKAEGAKTAEKLKDLEVRVKMLQQSCDKILESNDESLRRQVLAEIGVKDGSFDLRMYMKSLKIELDEAFSINKAIMQQHKDTAISNDELMSGLDF